MYSIDSKQLMKTTEAKIHLKNSRNTTLTLILVG